MASIPELEARKRKMQEVFSKADAALHTGKITKEQRDALLAHYYGTAREELVLFQIDEQIDKLREQPSTKRTTVLIAGFCILIISLFGALLWSTGGITGAVVLDTTQHVNTTYTTNATMTLNMNGTTAINVSGTMSGTGDVLVDLLMEGQQHLIYEHHGRPVSAHASMEKYQYTTSDDISFNVVNLSSAYLMTDSQAVPLNDTAIGHLSPGNYTLKLIINDTNLTEEELPFIVVTPNTPAPLVTFNTCGTLCSTNLTGNATLEITVVNATLDLQDISLLVKQNSAPQLVRQIPDISATGTASVDLQSYFTDAEGDPLLYDSTHHDGMTETITNSTFTVTGTPGTYTYIVYASDLQEITPSNIFSVTILENMSVNTTNPIVAPNISMTNITNSSINNESMNTTTITPTNNTIPPNTTLDCNNPDPNMRPLDCIQSNDSSYFKPEHVTLENKNAVVVGELTPVGNLLIRGGIIEHAAGTPASNDYQMGYEDANGDFVPTMWIDSVTGDLNLVGNLTEANGNIPIQEGLSAIANKRGIVLALINRNTGDLTVRGNVIPYRRSFG